MTNKGLHSPSSRLHTFLKHTETLSTCMQVALLDQNAFPHEAAVCRNENSKHTHFRPRADCLSYPPAPPIRTSDTGTGFLMVVVTCVTNASSFVHTRCFWHSFPLSTFRRSPILPVCSVNCSHARLAPAPISLPLHAVPMSANPPFRQ